MDQKHALPPDPCLLPFLHAREEPEARQQLAHLMGEAEPVIQTILRRKGFRPAGSPSQDGQTAEDLRGEVVLRLLKRLNDLHAAASEEAITSFRAFVATTTYHVYDDYLREKYPQRAGLKRKLLYLLSGRTNQHGFALWSSPSGRRMCGFAAWQGPTGERTRPARYDQLLADPHRFAGRALPKEPVERMNPADWLATLFHAVGGPMELHDLVHVVAELWGVKDQPAQLPEPREGEEGSDPVQELADPRGNVATEVEQRDYLRRLWTEIRQLPPRQCAALLLNLQQAGGGVIELLELQGIASFREIAAALDMPPEQFAELSNDLPIDDNAIAARLGCTRQQVINLRKVARERLERRMRAGEAE
jgi:DNA-directed RNA polymerase specialized sigma24 family protein